MTRVVVAFEGTADPNGRTIVPGALRVREGETVPVRYIWSQKTVGTASDMQRNHATGEISFEIQMWPGAEVPPENCEKSIFMLPVKVDKLDRLRELVTEGTIREITLMPTVEPVFPRTRGSW